MAITTSAGDGVRITTAAWCGVANSSTATSAVVNGRWAAGGNTNNCNTCACITFTDRVLVLRQGACNEEIKFITGETACATCDTTCLTIHEAWCTNPSACDTVHVSYIIQDAATLTGLGLLTKRLQDYSSSRVFNVGNTGACPAYALFAMVKGVSLETDGTEMSNCAPDVEVENNGHFINGYEDNGVGVNGGYFVFPNQTAGRCGFRANDGAILHILDEQFWGSVSNPEHRILGNCTTGTVRLKNIFGTRQLDVTAPNINYECWRVQGQDVTCDFFNVGGNITINGLEMVDMGAIRNINQNTCAETFTFRDVVFISNSADIITMQGASNNKTFILNNPKYTNDPPTCDITLLGAASTVQEQFRITATSQQTCGTKLQNTRFKIVESTPCAALVNEVNSDVCGVAVIDVVKREWTGACETLTTHACFALKTFDYGFTPFVTSQTVANKTGGFGQCTVIAQLTDDFVCAAECVAVADGTAKVTIIESTACNNHSLVKWTSGSGTLTSGDTIRQCATNLGTIHIIEGCSTAGSGIIVARTGTAVANCSTLCTAGGFSATYTNSSEKRFYFVYDAGSISCTDRSAQQLYDHQIAKLGEATLDTGDSWCKPILWGRTEHAIPFQGVACAGTICATFKTVRNVALTQGWGVIGLSSLGKITVFTADDGTTFSPQSTVNVTVTVNDESGTAVQGVKVGIFTCPVSPGDSALICGTSNACGVVTGSLTVAGDISANVRARLKGYIPFETTGTISAVSGLSVGVRFIRDTSVNLP